MTASLTSPLLYGAFVTHAHVTAHVQNAVYGPFVAYGTFGICDSCRSRLVVAPLTRRVNRRLVTTTR